MNLLPVIYASLLIFGSLFLIVLVTSYITYKVKQYNGNVALASADTRTMNNPKKIVTGNREKVNVVRKSYQPQPKVLKEKRQVISNPEIKPVERSMQYKMMSADEITQHTDKVKSVNKNSQVSRMTRIQNLRSGGSYSKPRTESHFNPVRESSKVSNSSILRYYEDF